jgi:hypothetical protein
MDLTIVAYTALAMSLLVSAVKMGGWILNADPAAVVNAGRWALAALPVLALAVLLWLAATGRWTAAILLAAFLLPVFVQAAPRWRALFGPFDAVRDRFRSSGGFASGRMPPDPELVERSVAVLSAYLAHGRPQFADAAPPQIEHVGSTASQRSGHGGERMSTQEAFDVLGLAPTTSPREVKEAHRHLLQLVDPQHGGTPYLIAKINEARDVLLGD